MSAAYLASSFLLPILLGELRARSLQTHLACALYVAGDAREALSFLSRDAPQRRLARLLGFATP